MASPMSYKSQFTKLHAIHLELKRDRHIFSFAASRDKIKSALFIILGGLPVLLGLGLFLDKKLNRHEIYFSSLVMSVLILLGGI